MAPAVKLQVINLHPKNMGSSNLWLGLQQQQQIFAVSGRLNVIKDQKRTNPIVRVRRK
jgi:hypothetical protein